MQQGLYHNKVNRSLTPAQRLRNQTCNCRIDNNSTSCVFRCLGSTQHLKSTYGSGYTLELKLKQSHTSGPCSEGSMEQLHNYVIELLPGATQSEVFGGRVIYKVPKEGVGALSVIFTKLEKGMVSIF